MRVERFEVREYSGAVHGARSATTQWETRRGFVLTARTRDGLVVQGEASPLPGYSPESYDDVASSVARLDWESLPEPDPHDDPTTTLAHLRRIGRLAAAPSVRFALETVFLDAAGQRAKRPIWSLLPSTASGAVPLSSLVGSADDAGAVDAARAALERGVAAVKMKVPAPLTDERLSRISAVRAAIGRAGLRLDANGGFALADARRDLAALRSADIEFIEEPVPSRDLSSLTDSPVQIALDESLQDPENWARLERDLKKIGCVALVLKPMALGGFAACIDWATRARAAGMHATISHLFDGPVALTACAHLALAVGSRRYGSGIDVHGPLRAWPDVTLPLHSENAIICGDRPGLGMRPLSGGPA